MNCAQGVACSVDRWPVRLRVEHTACAHGDRDLCLERKSMARVAHAPACDSSPSIFSVPGSDCERSAGSNQGSATNFTCCFMRLRRMAECCPPRRKHHGSTRKFGRVAVRGRIVIVQRSQEFGHRACLALRRTIVGQTCKSAPSGA